MKRKCDAFLDHSGAIGRRYRRLDEIGSPFAITVDHQTLEDETVTIRMRDSMEQKRIRISELDSRSDSINSISIILDLQIIFINYYENDVIVSE